MYVTRFSVNSQQIHSIRLTGGSNLYNGEVEVLYCANTSTCTWKPLCWKDWTDTEAVIACNQLGLNDSNSSGELICTCNSYVHTLIL